jgi:hypothetical protein
LKAQEFVTEDLNAGGFRIRVSPHLDNRAEKRGISMPMIVGILNRLDRARRHIKELEPNTQFNVFDSHHNIHLGMMRSSFDPNKLLLNTVYHNENYTTGAILCYGCANESKRIFRIQNQQPIRHW